MELALLVWLVSLLSSLGEFAEIFGVLFTIVTVIVGLLLVLVPDKEWNIETRTNCIKWVLLPKTAITLIFIAWIIPSEKTMQYMAGAYLLQSVYQSDIVQKAAPLAEKAILNQLQAWAKDNPEVATLIENVPVVKEQK